STSCKPESTRTYFIRFGICLLSGNMPCSLPSASSHIVAGTIVSLRGTNWSRCWLGLWSYGEFSSERSDAPARVAHLGQFKMSLALDCYPLVPRSRIGDSLHNAHVAQTILEIWMRPHATF